MKVCKFLLLGGYSIELIIESITSRKDSERVTFPLVFEHWESQAKIKTKLLIPQSLLLILLRKWYMDC